MASVRVDDLPLSWYQRPQYRPRLGREPGAPWFLLSPPFRPLEHFPVAPPREPPAGRAPLVAAFEATYSEWRIPVHEAGRQSLEKLLRPGTATIVTGQQPGFLGGPLHTLYKALSAVAAARRCELDSGRPCVPVFWVAADDHDFEEVREIRFPGPESAQVFRFPGKADRRPLADYPVDGRAEAVIDAAVSHLSARRHGAEAARLAGFYRDRGLASGFAALIADLLGHTGLLVIDPVRLRGIAARVLHGAIAEPEAVLDAVAAGRDAVARAGVEPFVAARLPLFVVQEGRRHHLSPAAGGLRIDGGGPEISRALALERLAMDPRAFSPGALLRPIVQEECMPCLLYIGGPAEAGYFAQLGPLAAHFGLEPPRIALRLNATAVDGKIARAAATVPPERLCAARSPGELLDTGAAPSSLQALQALTARLESDLVEAARELAPGQEADRLQRRARDLAGEVQGFVGRLDKARLASRVRDSDEARKLFEALLPDGELQERRWGFLHLVAKHGRGWIDELLAAIEPDPLRIVHRLIAFQA